MPFLLKIILKLTELNVKVNIYLSICSISTVTVTLCGNLMTGGKVSLGEQIRKRRQSLKITQKELAHSIGVTPQYISLIEQDKGVPSLSSLSKIAEELGVTVDYLITGKEGVVTDTIAAIKADKSLKVETKKALIAIVKNLRENPDLQ